MTEKELAEILHARAGENGAITKYDKSGSVPYRIELLPPGEMNELRIERHAYLADRGIEECTPATAEIYDEELRLRVLARAVRDPATGEPLASLDVWRETQGAAVRMCLAHYTKLEAQADAIDLACADRLTQLTAYVRQEQGVGRGAFWERVDYETLLACFVALSLAHDHVVEHDHELARENTELRAQVERLTTDLEACKRKLATHKHKR